MGKQNIVNSISKLLQLRRLLLFKTVVKPTRQLYILNPEFSKQKKTIWHKRCQSFIEVHYICYTFENNAIQFTDWRQQFQQIKSNWYQTDLFQENRKTFIFKTPQSMPTADQYQSILKHWSRCWSVFWINSRILTGIDWHWLALGIDQGSHRFEIVDYLYDRAWD